MISGERLGAHRALGRVAAKNFAACAEITNFLAVLRRAIERHLAYLFIAHRDAEARPELAQLILVEFLLLVCDVLPFSRFAKPVTLDGPGENNRGATLMVGGGLVSRIDLAGIVTAKTEPPERLVGKRLDELQQSRIAAEEKLANIFAR